MYWFDAEVCNWLPWGRRVWRKYDHTCRCCVCDAPRNSCCWRRREKVVLPNEMMTANRTNGLAAHQKRRIRFKLQSTPSAMLSTVDLTTKNILHNNLYLSVVEFGISCFNHFNVLLLHSFHKKYQNSLLIYNPNGALPAFKHAVMSRASHLCQLRRTHAPAHIPS